MAHQAGEQCDVRHEERARQQKRPRRLTGPPHDGSDDHQRGVVERQDSESAPRVEPRVVLAAPHSCRRSSRRPVMRNPDSTKNRSTPSQPGLVSCRTARESHPSSCIPLQKNAWYRNTDRIATPRSESSTGIRSPARIGGAEVGVEAVFITTDAAERHERFPRARRDLPDVPSASGGQRPTAQPAAPAPAGANHARDTTAVRPGRPRRRTRRRSRPLPRSCPESRLRRRRAEQHRHAGGEVREDLVAEAQAPVQHRRLLAGQPQVVAARQAHHRVRAARLVQRDRERRRRGRARSASGRPGTAA